MTRAHRRGPWIPEEDNTLMQLVQSQGPNNWVRISQHMHYRSPKQCRERFHQNLKPTLNHEPITAEEGEMIEQMVADMGKRWAEIARRLGNRSDNAVKNWWNGSMNRRRRNVIQTTSKTLSNRIEPLSLTRSSMMPVSVNHRHSYSRSWTESQPTMTRPLHSPHSYFQQSYSQQTDVFRDHRKPLVERRDQQLPPLGMSRTASHHSVASLASPTPPGITTCLPNPFSHTGRPTPMLLLPSPQRRLEAPLVSPVGSEVSNSMSIERAPSLVSDHNSNSSISPKTMHSPRPDLPLPVDTRSFRRGSAPSIQTPGQSYNGDEGYISALPQSANMEGKHFSSQIPFLRPEDSHLAHPGHWQPGHHHSHSASQPPLPPLLEQPVDEKVPRSARDARMTFSSLLN